MFTVVLRRLAKRTEKLIPSGVFSRPCTPFRRLYFLDVLLFLLHAPMFVWNEYAHITLPHMNVGNIAPSDPLSLHIGNTVAGSTQILHCM